MSIAPVTKNINPCIEKIQQKGKVIVQSLNNNPGGKIGGWTYRGYGAAEEVPAAEKFISGIGKDGKSLNSLNYLA